MEWILIGNFFIFCIGFIYMIKAYREERRLDMLIAYLGVLLGLFFGVFKFFMGSPPLKTYFLFLQHYIGVLGPSITFMLACYFANKRMEEVRK